MDGARLLDAGFRMALTREPTAEETAVLTEIAGAKPTPQSVEDLLWAVLLLPEFQFVR